MQKELNVVCPSYLSKRTLPYVSEVLYHNQIIYALPTGISPTEWENVLSYPEYCMKRSIALPGIFWEMTTQYFECAKEAIECSDILQPLKKHIVKSCFVYPRDIKAVEESKHIIREDKELLNAFLKTAVDFNFLSREILSHILFEVYLERGFEDIQGYVLDEFKNVSSIELLMAAVITNRMTKISSNRVNILVNDVSWHPYIIEYSKRFGTESINDIEMLTYRLFEAIITPIYGRCDTIEKSENVAKLLDKQKDAVDELKRKCNKIVQNCLLSENDKYDFKEHRFRELLNEEIIEPLSEISQKGKKDIQRFITDFLLDSTVIGGFLGITQGADLESLGIATAAGLASTGLKYIVSERKNKIVEPAKILVEGMKKNHKNYLEYEQMLVNMSFEQLKV